MKIFALTFINILVHRTRDQINATEATEVNFQKQKYVQIGWMWRVYKIKADLHL